MKLLSKQRYEELLESEKNLEFEERSCERYRNLSESQKRKINSQDILIKSYEEENGSLKAKLEESEVTITDLKRENVSLQKSKNSNEYAKTTYTKKIKDLANQLEEVKTKVQKESKLKENLMKENEKLREQILKIKPHAVEEYRNNGLPKSQRKKLRTN